MSPVVLQSVARAMVPVLMLLSVVMLVRGHDAPGGGFVGGLLAAAALTLQLIAFDVGTLRRTVRVRPSSLLACGLLVALGSGVPALGVGRPFLTGLWWWVELPWGGHLELGTPLFFDTGVYLLVAGATLSVLISLEEREEEELAEDRARGGQPQAGG